MTKFASVLVIAAVALMAGTASAAEPGNIDNGTLAAMGLADMQVMSDVEGQSVRGQGYAAAWGSAGTSFFGSNSNYNYDAVSDGPGSNFAGGAAGGVTVGGFATNAFGPGVTWGVLGVASVGGSFAYSSN